MLEFNNAKPIWLKDLLLKKNIRVILKVNLTFSDGDTVKIKLATSGIYHLDTNQCFTAYGPARAGKNHFRMDIIDVSHQIKSGENEIKIEVAGYNTTSFYIQNQPSFIQAEVVQNGEIVAFTGDNRFSYGINTNVIQKTQRYSYQRPMTEAYHYNGDGFQTCDIEICDDKQIIERYAPYPVYEQIKGNVIESGMVKTGIKPEIYYRDRALTAIDDCLTGFTMEELEICLSDEIQEMICQKSDTPDFSERFPTNCYKIYEFPYVATGMPCFHAKASGKVDIYCVYDELLDDQVSWNRAVCCNVVKYTLTEGEYYLQFFEVYTLRYLKIMAMGAECEISNISLVEYKHPPVAKKMEAVERDPVLKKIYDAAINTYRQNAVDLFTDCPSRERAGWLCDSFFTARVEYVLTGQSKIEKSFFENFLHEDKYQGLPDGMLPMCYPADHYNGQYIPNWAMWAVIELEEYLARSGDHAMIEQYREKVYALLRFFEKYENSDGLLEKLDSWIFVEWSKANDLVQDVNYPTNMLYVRTLRAAARLYHDHSLIQKADKIKEIILTQSFDGEFFTDNAVRVEGKLMNSGETTEVCQYYAFFFGIADTKTHEKLLRILVNDFGPDRQKNHKYPNVHFANAFIGNYLRLDLLLNYGYSDKVIENIRGYFLHMAEITGTLWEHDKSHGSLDHGFASHVVYWLDKIYHGSI